MLHLIQNLGTKKPVPSSNSWLGGPRAWGKDKQSINALTCESIYLHFLFELSS